MAEDKGESLVPTVRTRTTKSVEEKKEAARIRQTRYREKLKADPVKHEQHLLKERVRDKERRAAPKTRAQVSRTRVRARIRMQNSRKKNKEREESDEMLKKRKGILKMKQTLYFRLVDNSICSHQHKRSLYNTINTKRRIGVTTLAQRRCLLYSKTEATHAMVIYSFSDMILNFIRCSNIFHS